MPESNTQSHSFIVTHYRMFLTPEMKMRGKYFLFQRLSLCPVGGIAGRCRLQELISADSRHTNILGRKHCKGVRHLALSMLTLCSRHLSATLHAGCKFAKRVARSVGRGLMVKFRPKICPVPRKKHSKA